MFPISSSLLFYACLVHGSSMQSYADLPLLDDESLASSRVACSFVLVSSGPFYLDPGKVQIF